MRITVRPACRLSGFPCQRAVRASLAVRGYPSSVLAGKGNSFETAPSDAYTGVRLPMGNGLSLGTRVNVDYDAVPAAGKDTTDTALIFKLDYAL